MYENAGSVPCRIGRHNSQVLALEESDYHNGVHMSALYYPQISPYPDIEGRCRDLAGNHTCLIPLATENLQHLDCSWTNFVDDLTLDKISEHHMNPSKSTVGCCVLFGRESLLRGNQGNEGGRAKIKEGSQRKSWASLTSPEFGTDLATKTDAMRWRSSNWKGSIHDCFSDMI